MQAILIFSSDPLAAALLGAAGELAGCVPHYAREDEAARAALLRVRPAVVLIDCDHEETCSDEFVGPALMTDAKVVLFHSRSTRRDMQSFADRLSLHVMNMPADITTFGARLRELLGS
ncbi:MAG: hypothetical protein ABJA80_03565 [bacterium]